MSDYYNILGVTRGATDDDLKRAYRKLAMRWHPDKNADDAENAAQKFQEIAEAYEVLSDREKRAIYDQYGEEGLRNGVPDGDGGTRGGFDTNVDAGKIFESFFGTANPFSDFGFGDTMPFGSAMRQTGPKQAPTVQSNLECSLEELFNGCTKRLNITRKRLAPNGLSLVDDTKTLNIQVKPGWKRGTKITFPKEGDEAPGVTPANVVFVLVEKAHESFIRESNNLVYTAKIPLVEALTDTAVQVPTLDGRVLSIPCNEVISPGYQKVIPGEGMPFSKEPGKRGDLVLRFKIIFPDYVSDQKKAELKKLLQPTKEGAPGAPESQ
jgi:DnaJ-class molecular chaperone